MSDDVKVITIICLAFLLFLSGLIFHDLKKEEWKRKQPKYLIEIKNNMYELKKLDEVEE